MGPASCSFSTPPILNRWTPRGYKTVLLRGLQECRLRLFTQQTAVGWRQRLSYSLYGKWIAGGLVRDLFAMSLRRWLKATASLRNYYYLPGVKTRVSACTIAARSTASDQKYIVRVRGQQTGRILFPLQEMHEHHHTLIYN